MTTGNYIADVVGMRKLVPVTSKYTPDQSSMRVFAQLLINEWSSINNGNSAKSQWINSVFKKINMLSYGGIHLCFDNTGITQSKTSGAMIHSTHLP